MWRRVTILNISSFSAAASLYAKYLNIYFHQNHIVAKLTRLVKLRCKQTGNVLIYLSAAVPSHAIYLPELSMLNGLEPSAALLAGGP